MKISRRDWMRVLGAGVGAASLPLLSRLSSAQEDGAPLRFLVLYDHTGFTHHFARPRRPGEADWRDGDAPGALPSADAWELGPAFSPFAAYRDLMVPIEGMDSRSARIPQAPAGGGGHGHLETNALTASPRVYLNRPGGASIDQIVADGLFAQGVVTPLHSVRVGFAMTRAPGSPLFRNDGTRLPFTYQPPNVYDTLFPPEMIAESSERMRLGERWAAAEALGREIADARERQLTGDQRRRYALHRELRSAHQERLLARLGGLPMGASAPDREVLLQEWRSPGRYDRAPSEIEGLRAWELSASANAQMVSLALQLDLTRVAVVGNNWLPYELWQPPGEEAYRPPSRSGASDGTFGTLQNHAFHHELVSYNHSHGERGERYMTYYHQRVNEPFVRILDALRDATDSDGSSVLDNTVVLFAGQMATPAHTGDQLHYGLLLGANAARHMGVTTGRPLLLQRGQREGEPMDAEEWRTRNNHRGPSHAQLFQTLGEAFGVDPAMGPEWLRPSPMDLNEAEGTALPPFERPDY
ncbi:MAG: DUF1552 domain-containing protein [Myxococcota bacterium]